MAVKFSDTGGFIGRIFFPYSIKYRLADGLNSNGPYCSLCQDQGPFYTRSLAEARCNDQFMQ